MAEDAETGPDVDEGADAPDTDAEGGEVKKKASPLKLALFIGLPVLILLLAGVGAALVLLGGGDETVAETETDEDGFAYEGGASVHHATYRFDAPVIVQVRAASGAMMLLSMNIELEIADPELAGLLDERMGRVLDQYAAFLRELTPDDLSGSAGLHRVRLELLRRTNLAIAPERVEGVLITQMLVTQS